MTELIRVYETGGISGCNGRELHEILGVRRDFTNWMKARIEKYGFEEGVDYVKFDVLRSPNPASAKSREVSAIEYHLSLDMAKELAMVENNEKGREARRYFIACEKALQEARRKAFDQQAANWNSQVGINQQLAEEIAATRRDCQELMGCLRSLTAEHIGALGRSGFMVEEQPAFDVAEHIHASFDGYGVKYDKSLYNGLMARIHAYSIDNRVPLIQAAKGRSYRMYHRDMPALNRTIRNFLREWFGEPLPLFSQAVQAAGRQSENA